jgi:hypothetical protein
MKQGIALGPQALVRGEVAEGRQADDQDERRQGDGHEQFEQAEAA